MSTRYRRDWNPKTIRLHRSKRAPSLVRSWGVQGQRFSWNQLHQSCCRRSQSCWMYLRHFKENP